MKKFITVDDREPNKTYKIEPPDNISRDAIYFTVVGVPVPEAFFVDCKRMESFQWVVSLMTAWSRQIEAGVAIENIINDMKETFDPGGRYIIPGTNHEVPSIVHHMGLLLEEHCASSPDESPCDVEE